jgi:hypothetical protein
MVVFGVARVGDLEQTLYAVNHHPLAAHVVCKQSEG